MPSSSSSTARSWVTGVQWKPPVIRRCTRRSRPLSSRSRRYLPRRSTETTRSPSSSSATSKRSYGRVRRGSRISTRVSVLPSSRGASCARIVSTSGSSGNDVLLDDVEQDSLRGEAPPSPISYAASTAPAAASAEASSRAWTSASTWPVSTVWPRFALQTMPTEWSMVSSFVRRPPPSSRLAIPIGSAASRVTTPARGATTSWTTGARGSASRSGSPPCARIQRSYVSLAEPSVIACRARSRPSSTSTPRSDRARRRAQASRTSSMKSGGPSPAIVSTASRTSSALPTAAPSG